MTITQYFKRRIRGFFVKKTPPPVFVPVTCHECHKTVVVRQGMLGRDLEEHFQTTQHAQGKARRQW